MSNEQSLEEIQLKLREKLPESEIISLLYNQLSKDFNSAGLQLTFEPDESPKNWIKHIEIVLETIDQTILSRLLYTIDIPDWKLRTIHSNEALASGILYREYVKIYYRLHFS